MTGAPHQRHFSTLARVLLLAVITSGLAFGWTWDVLAAQPGMGGGQGPIGPAGAPPGQRKEKKEGPAEEAPKDKEALRPIEPVPAQPRRLRRVQLFDLHGYLRMRADYFHRLNLGLADQIGEGDRPFKFFRPPAESLEVDEDGNTFPNDANCLSRLTASGVSSTRATTRCRRRQGFASANMRLRLEPTLHITDTVKVHSQMDVLDNVVLGSTPDSYASENPGAPIDLFTRSQVPPSDGVNSLQDSVVVKRAWGQIRFGWGLDLQFGRMPWSWGMGLVANHGNGYYKGEKADIIRHLDRDFGDSVDQVRFGFDFGKDRRRTHTVAATWGWASSGRTAADLLGREWASGNTLGQTISVERFDNVHQWSVSLERRDEPEMLERKLSLGNPVVNYGIISWLRYQDVDTATFSDPENLQQYINRLVHRRAIVATPDLWLRVNWRTLRVELEVAGSFGVFRLRDLDVDPEQFGGDVYYDGLTRNDLSRRTLANFGYALEFKYGFFQDRFHIGFDQGFASGDTASPLEANPLSPLNENDNNAITNFRFNPAYNVDLLMFREILGTVSNAAYFKPWAAFYFFDHFSARVDIEYALAARRQATLGNRWSYGIELDGAVRYHDAREPIFFQLQYGVMFPLAAFDRLRVRDGEQNVGRENARAVQTLQAQIGIRF
jgi:uncharacterized protein (TIGR04551 family)